MKRLTLFLIVLGLIVFNYVPNAMANGVYFSQIPEGLEKDCGLCHSSVPNLNDFGEKFKANNYDFTGLAGNQTGEPPSTGTGQPQDQPGTSGPTGRQNVNIELILPSGGTRGEKTQLQAKVTAGGTLLAGKQVNFFAETDFFGQNKINLGSASTGTDGIARISYWPQTLDEKVNVIVVVDEDTQVNAAQAAGSLDLALTGSLYHKGEGLEIPFLGNWVIGLVVGGIWATYFYAGYTVLGIRKIGQIKEQEVIREEDEEERSEAQARA